MNSQPLQYKTMTCVRSMPMPNFVTSLATARRIVKQHIVNVSRARSILSAPNIIALFMIETERLEWDNREAEMIMLR